MNVDSSKKVIYAALIGNSLIAICKFTASMITGSSAMLSEAIHSLVDTGNQGLLLFGMKRAKRPADARHPFGYGGEIYFWAFTVAVIIFAVGAGVSIYEGWHKLLHPEPMKSIMVNYVVLTLAIIFEGFALAIAVQEFNHQKSHEEDYITAVRASKDPRIFTVLFEDTAAMLGLIVALVGISVSHYLHMPWVDGLASIIIGIILAFIAVFLAYECKGLLIGESARPEMVAAIHKLLENASGNAQINEVLTVHFGPDDVLVTVSMDVKDSASAGDVKDTITDIEEKMKAAFPAIKRVFIEIQDVKEHFENSPTVQQEST